MSAFWTPAASPHAHQVDVLFFSLVALSAVITLLVFGLLIGFSMRYRRGRRAERTLLPEVLSREIEIGWTAATLFLFLFIFWWASSIDLTAMTPPSNALQIHVYAKQWMWEAQHSSGAREINAVHLPVDTEVRLSMTSQDVIHSFFVPALRIKQDVLPGDVAPTEIWFRATKLGTFGLLCAEYCGTDHSAMRGKIVVMRRDDYAKWLQRQPRGDDLAHQGKQLFVARGCAGCHAGSSAVHAPSLVGIYNKPVQLSNGKSVVANDAYIRDSILQPTRDIVAGYEPIMPSFSGVLGNGEIEALVAYIRSLSDPGAENP